jgi:phytoene synthase
MGGKASEMTDWVAGIADPERRLALAYAPRDRRADLALLWALDERLGAVVAATHEEMIGRIRLAWWREALEVFGQGAPAGEPLLEGLFSLLQRRGVSAAALARLPEGWAALLGAMPLDAGSLESHAEERGAALFALSAAILDGDGPGVANAGAAWALTDLAARISDSETAGAARSLAGERLNASGGARWARALRPLAILTALARHDHRRGFPRRQGSPRRLAIVIRAGMIGR